eukprot:TRINITY_DN11731_c0_g1_i1.p1 TRINITY_DN11731_c0_g1~~TRINITY_DN11731_c0_g1_i1.p1  ORF type:complete len:291 (-),score=46.99 TRINITY_DN11731_c0_g1_i1:478-1350(-)
MMRGRCLAKLKNYAAALEDFNTVMETLIEPVSRNDKPTFKYLLQGTAVSIALERALANDAVGNSSRALDDICLVVKLVEDQGRLAIPAKGYEKAARRMCSAKYGYHCQTMITPRDDRLHVSGRWRRLRAQLPAAHFYAAMAMDRTGLPRYCGGDESGHGMMQFRSDVFAMKKDESWVVLRDANYQEMDECPAVVYKDRMWVLGYHDFQCAELIPGQRSIEFMKVGDSNSEVVRKHNIKTHAACVLGDCMPSSLADTLLIARLHSVVRHGLIVCTTTTRLSLTVARMNGVC